MSAFLKKKIKKKLCNRNYVFVGFAQNMLNSKLKRKEVTKWINFCKEYLSYCTHLCCLFRERFLKKKYVKKKICYNTLSKLIN